MENTFKCPLCGDTEKCKKEITDAIGYLRYYCDEYNSNYYISDEIINKENEIKERCYNLIAEDLLHKSLKKDEERVYKYDYCEGGEIESLDNIIHINIAEKMKDYPQRAVECAERALINLAIKFPHYGDILCPFYRERRYLFEHEHNNAGTFGVLEL